MSPTQQRAVALSTANRIRTERANAKKLIRTLPRDEARAMVADIIENPEREFRSIRLGELLFCIARVHHAYAKRLLIPLDLHLDVRLRELKVVERIALGDALRSNRRYAFPQVAA